MAGPTIRRRQLGIELKRLREAVGMTRSAAAAAIGCSATRIAYIELGRNVLGKAELIVLLRNHYDAADALPALEELRQEASKRGWWSTYGLPEWLAGYVGLEYDASTVRTFELELIPGLLQTEAYARLLHQYSGKVSTKDLDRRVAARMQRQERLKGDDPLHLVAVVSEGALVRCARHVPVAADQLTHLVDCAQWPNVDLHVLPFDAGVHAGVSGAFTLLSFPDHLLDDAAHQEYAVGGHIVDDETAVAQLDSLFDKLRSQALATNDSLAVLAELVDNTS